MLERRRGPELRGGPSEQENFFRNALMVGDTREQRGQLLQRLLPQPFSLLSGVVDTRPYGTLGLAKAVVYCRRDQSADYLDMAARLGSYRVEIADGSHEMLFTDQRLAVKGGHVLPGKPDPMQSAGFIQELDTDFPDHGGMRDGPTVASPGTRSGCSARG